MNQLKDANEKRAMLGAIKEIGEQLLMMDDAREQIKEIINATSDALDVEKSLIRKVAKLYYKKNAASFENETSVIKDLYKGITTI